jgi:hypothetical protein
MRRLHLCLVDFAERRGRAAMNRVVAATNIFYTCLRPVSSGSRWLTLDEEWKEARAGIMPEGPCRHSSAADASSLGDR